MSLINQMLRDLETRHADGSEKLGLPDEVRSLPAEAEGLPWLKPLLAVVAAGIVVAAMVWGVMALLSKPAPSAASLPSTPPDWVPNSNLSAPHPQTAGVIARKPSPVVPRSVPQPPRRVESTLPSPAESAAMANQPKLPASQSVADIPKAHIDKSAPTDSNSIIQRAREQINAGQRDAAEATLRQSLATNPGQIGVRQLLFALLIEDKRSDEALTLLQAGLVEHPEQTQWAMNAARLQVDRADYNGAWETLQQALPAATTQGDYRAFCGTVLTRLKRYGEAVEHYQAALRTNATEGRWWVGMALALEAEGKQPESREAFARAQATGKLTPELSTFVDGKLKQ